MDSRGGPERKPEGTSTELGTEIDGLRKLLELSESEEIPLDLIEERLEALKEKEPKSEQDLKDLHLLQFAQTMKKRQRDMNPQKTSALRAAAQSLRTSADAADPYVGDGRTFANLLSKKWRTVEYDEARNAGTANLGGLVIRFQESGSDPAVLVTITSHPYMKGDPAQVAKALESIRRIMANIG